MLYIEKRGEQTSASVLKYGNRMREYKSIPEKNTSFEEFIWKQS